MTGFDTIQWALNGFNLFGRLSSLFFYRATNLVVSGRAVDPARAANETITYFDHPIKMPKGFVRDNILAVHPTNHKGIKKIGFTFNIEALKPYQLELMVSHLKHGDDHHFYPGYVINASMKKLVYQALLTIEKLTQEKIKYFETNNFNGPLIVIANCGQEELKTTLGFHLNLRHHNSFAHHSLVCLREIKNQQLSLHTMIHEFFHAEGVAELRNDVRANHILKQRGGAFSSTMFYPIDRYHQRDFADPRIAFIGPLDHALLNETIHAKISPNFQDATAMAFAADMVRQMLINFCYMTIFTFFSSVADRNKKNLMSEKNAMLLAQSCVIALMWYFDSTPDAIVLQVGFLIIDTMNNVLPKNLLALPLTGLSLYHQIELFQQHGMLKLGGQWATLLLGTILGIFAGYKSAQYTSAYIPLIFSKQVVTGDNKNHIKSAAQPSLKKQI
jgi:hypothetical protein